MWPRLVAAAAGLDPDEVEATMAGLNHACWSVEVAYPGEEDFFDLVEAAWAGRPADANGDGTLQLLQLAATMRSIPADYLRYFYFGPTILAEQQTARRSRAEQLIEESPGYWEHYREEAEKADPRIDPARARAGVGELELAVEVIEAAVGDRRSTFTVNMPNRGAIAGFDDDLVVEIPAVCSGSGFVSTIEAARLPAHVLGLIEMLAEYQRLAAHAGWSGDRRDGVRALAAHPFVLSLPAAEALYAAMASAQAPVASGSSAVTAPRDYEPLDLTAVANTQLESLSAGAVEWHGLPFLIGERAIDSFPAGSRSRSTSTPRFSGFSSRTS